MREPNTTDMFTTLGPGRNCDSEKASMNSSAVIQRFSSTISRRAQGRIMPMPDTDILAKPRNSSDNEGGSCSAGGFWAGVTAASDEGGMAHDYPLIGRAAKPFLAWLERAIWRRGLLFFRQPSLLIFMLPAQAGYGDKWPS